MLCTFTEAYKCLGFKSRASIYQLKEKGILDPYIRRINDKKYLYMGAIKGITLAKHIENNLVRQVITHKSHTEKISNR